MECESYCISKLRQKAKINRSEAERILEKAILLFREKVLSGKVVAVANLKEYIFLTCWEILREEKRASDASPRDLKAAFFEMAKKAYSREIQQEIKEGDPRYFEKIFEASRWAYDRLDAMGKQILMLYYHHQCNLNTIASMMEPSRRRRSTKVEVAILCPVDG